MTEVTSRTALGTSGQKRNQKPINKSDVKDADCLKSGSRDEKDPAPLSAFDRWMEGLDWDFSEEKDKGDQLDLL